jgi:allophanate hydrolase
MVIDSSDPRSAAPQSTESQAAESPSADLQATDLQATVLRSAYLDGDLRVTDVIAAVYDRIEARGDDGVWISLVPREAALARAATLDAALDTRRHASRGPASTTELPALFGLPFAVKDNIDVAGLPTTAGCPGFATEPVDDAPGVAALLAAGAVCVGKTNLDQFATGLTGARSPYGTPVSPFDPTMIAGGSSSGSGVAVAVGLVSFAIGTDTAGSGRVPAALCNVVGVKPSRGLVSTRGLVPACRSLDCLSVFALSVPDARLVLSVMNGYDPADPYSRRLPLVRPEGAMPHPRPPAPLLRTARTSRVRIGVARAEDLTFFGDEGARAVYERGIGLLQTGDDGPVPVDLTPFLAAGELLYGGPWLAERFASVGEFVLAHPDQTHPVVRSVLEPGGAITGADTFRGLSRLRSLHRTAGEVWRDIDVLVLPTVPTTYPLAAVLAEPVGLNARLGRYTTFANLLDLAAVAVPVGFAGTLPHGLTLLAPAGRDDLLADLAADLHRRAGLPVGATGRPLAPPAPPTPQAPSIPQAPSALLTPPVPPGPPAPVTPSAGTPVRGRTPAGFLDLAVVGAHLAGQPRNGELTRLGAVLLRRDRTLPRYRLYALPGPGSGRPGLLRVTTGGGAVEAEVWRLPVEAAGTFLLGVPVPLAIGTVDLAGGPTLGFLCESAAVVDGAVDITTYGGWRSWLAAARPGPVSSRVP